MEISKLYQYYIKSFLVCTDTRKIRPGCLFFALKGGNFDGNEFAQDAIDKGAQLAVVDNKKYHVGNKTILVSDALATLQELAAFHRKQLATPIIGLTGSNGKTTTKELINAVLSAKYITKATEGNLNNHIGVPLTLLSMTADTEIGIVEMGANHLDEIAFLCSLAKPDYGYITNFGKAHLEGFGSLEGVIKGKSELYQYLRLNDKTAFVNAGDKNQVALTKEFKSTVFGESNAEIKIELSGLDPFVKLKFKKLQISSNLIGRHNFDNIAAAIAIGNYFKVSAEDIKKSIEAYIPENNRSQLLNLNSNRIILDAYNANPTSMAATLNHLAHFEEGKKIAILGDMFELGASAAAEHQHILDLLAELGIEQAYLIGSNFYSCHNDKDNIKLFENYEAFKKDIKVTSFQDSTILIKGSRGMALERILDLF